MLDKFFSAKENCQRQKNKSKKRTAKLLVVIVLLAVFLFIPQVKAAAVDLGLTYAAATGLPSQDIRIVIANVIRVALGLLGVVALSLLIFGGYIWMTAAGNPEKVEKAKKILINAAIGLAIILSAYGIVSFIIGAITGGAGGGGGGGVTPYGGGGGALGNGIIQSHYPARNATGIPRNTSIAITFKEPMNVSTLIDDNGTPNDVKDDKLNITNIKIRKSSDLNGPYVTDVRASYTTDLKTFLFKPVNPLGSSDQNTKYTVVLTDGIKKQNSNESIFGALGGYSWEFEVSTIIDITPPRIISVIPVASQTYPRNVVVQINFSEPINPMTIGGKTYGTEPFDKITVATTTAPSVAGEFYYSNQYQTTEFVTNDLCGKNTCGGNVYCLPGQSTITVTAKAATLESGSQFAHFPFDGIVDMADNSLDGNNNGTSEGPASIYDLTAPDPSKGDNVAWSFNTSNEIRLQPPLIISRTPTSGSTDNVNPSETNSFEIIFDSLIMASTIKPDSNYGDGLDYIGLVFPPQGDKAYWLESKNITLPNQDSPTQTRAIIYHATLAENTVMSIKVGSGVKDIYQNCYKPCAGPGCNRVETGTPGIFTPASDWKPNTDSFPSCTQ
jgi:hypothetical protein